MAITEEKIKQALLAFNRDADGRILPNEIILSQLSLGVFLQPEAQDNFITKATAGVNDYKSATYLIKETLQGRDPAKEIADMFSVFDTKQDGTISSGELKAVLQNLGEILTEPQIENALKNFSNGDRLDYKALIDYLLA